MLRRRCAVTVSRLARCFPQVVRQESKLVQNCCGLGGVLVSLGRDGAVPVDDNGALHGRTASVDAINTVGAGDAFLEGYLAADASGLLPADRLTWALRWGATAVQHRGMVFSQVDDRIPVRIAAAESGVALSEPATP